MNRATINLAGLAIGATVVALLAYGGWLPGLARQTSSTASSGSAAATSPTSPGGASEARLGTVVALARLQPAGGVLELGGVPGDRIEKVSVKPGQAVRRDDVLLTFDSRKLRQLELDAADTQLIEAEARLKAEQAYADALVREAQLGLDQLALDDMELTAQETRVKSLRQQAETATRNYDRVAKLSAALTSPQQLDQVQLQRDQAQNELAAAQEQIKRLTEANKLKRREAESKRDQAIAGRAKVDAAVPLESLRKAKAASAERLKSATLQAPGDGIVLEVSADEGDSVGQTPLVRLADVRTMVAVAEVYETQVGSIAENQTVELTADALPRKLQGVVERVGTTVGKNRMLSLDPTQSTDAHVVEVRIRLDEASSAVAAKFVGLQATAAIKTAN